MTTHELKRAMQIFEQYEPDAQIVVTYQGKLVVDACIGSERHRNSLYKLGWNQIEGTWSKEGNS